MKKNKTLAITLPLMLVLLVAGAYRYGYVKIRTDIDALKEEQAVKLRLLEKSAALIAEKPDIEKRLAALKGERQADSTKLIEGQTLSLSAATLQETIKGIVTGRGGSISSERVGKPEDYGNFKVITVSIDTVIPDARALSDILYSIETRTPYLVVKELDTRVRNFRDPKELTVKLDISALTGGK
ncbi:MAG: type II secretion system protein GspM [Nitrospiraceae bacterium]|nr:type II secretion system protein GspM [Nitrospiraceae bacterium]